MKRSKLFNFFLAALFSASLSAAETPPKNSDQEFDSTLEIINALLQSPDDQVLTDKAYEAYQKDIYTGLALYIAATRENETNTLAPYNAACALFQLNQTDLGMRFLSTANQRGMIDYKLLEEDKDLNEIRHDDRFKEILKDTQKRHQAEELKTAGKMDYVLPQNKLNKVDGYPVIVWLHGYRINGNVQEDQFLANSLDSAIMGINGTNLEDYDAFSWDLDNYQKIHASIQKGLDELTKTVKIDRNKVYVYGFSQGAAAAARMLATYPDAYQGGLIVAPSYFDESLPNKAKNQKIVLTHGKSDFDNIMKATKLIEPAFKKNNSLKYETYAGKHHYPADWETSFVEYFKWMMK